MRFPSLVNEAAISRVPSNDRLSGTSHDPMEGASSRQMRPIPDGLK